MKKSPATLSGGPGISEEALLEVLFEKGALGDGVEQFGKCECRHGVDVAAA
jgi:hypothetical protein